MLCCRMFTCCCTGFLHRWMFACTRTHACRHVDLLFRMFLMVRCRLFTLRAAWCYSSPTPSSTQSWCFAPCCSKFMWNRTRAARYVADSSLAPALLLHLLANSVSAKRAQPVHPTQRTQRNQHTQRARRSQCPTQSAVKDYRRTAFFKLWVSYITVLTAYIFDFTIRHFCWRAQISRFCASLHFFQLFWSGFHSGFPRGLRHQRWGPWRSSVWRPEAAALRGPGHPHAAKEQNGAGVSGKWRKFGICKNQCSCWNLVA